MVYTDIALKIWAAKECGLLKTNAQFWTNFPEAALFEKYIQGNAIISNAQEKLFMRYSSADAAEGVICAFDEGFPVINPNVNKGDKPYLLFYKGDLSLLSDLNKNVAVIGLIDPTTEIERRATEVVQRLVKNGLIIVSGLAKGCDTIAHKTCLENKGKTIAILPSPIGKISPSTNRSLAKEIVAKGGLLLTEYDVEPVNRNVAINRYIERDRLQAMFAKAVVLIASYRKGQGDSGSRHAMEAAKNYGVERYVMFNANTDMDDNRFGLNRDFICLNNGEVKIVNNRAIESITTQHDPRLVEKAESVDVKQLTLFDYDR